MNATQATIGTVTKTVPTLKLRLKPEPSLKDLCCEHIKDSFYYGVYGDTSSPDTCFRLIIDQKTGFFNATKMCQTGGKRMCDWLRLASSKELVKYYCDRYAHLRSGPSPTYEVNGGNKDAEGATISGTYVCKELILAIAMWISIPFYDKCSEIVNNVFIPKNASMDHEEREAMMKLLKEKDAKIEGLEEQVQEKEDKIEQLIKEMRDRDMAMNKKVDSLHNKMDETIHQNVDLKEQNGVLINKVVDLKDKVTTVQKKLNIAVVDRAPQPDKSIKKERFVMMKRSDEEYPYYVVRGQTAYTASVIKREKGTHDTVTILVDFLHHPNSKTFFNRVKDQLREHGVDAIGNAIRLDNSDVAEEELIKIMNAVNAEKKLIDC